MDTQRQWLKILDKIKEQISAANFKTWFSQTTIGDITDKKLVLKVPSAFIKGQLISRYESLLKESVKDVTGKELTVEYQIDSSLIGKRTQEAPTDEPFEFGVPITPPAQASGVNPKYTLESFVVGLTNNLAYAAAQAVVQNPGTTYNPLFIYGPSGVGKTHLMHAIGNALLKKNSHLRLICASSEKFMNDFVLSIQNKRTGDFRIRYRSADIMLIDDIQFISGKDSTQEEFFHTYNEIHTKNCQIVLTSDKPPQEIAKLEDRLRSRFQGGLMVDIQLPDFDTRMAILKAKLQERGESMDEECIRLIAEGVESNSRELEGKLIQIIQLCKLQNKTPDLETVKGMLGRKTSPQATLDPKKVINGVNQYFNLKMSDLVGPRRQKELVLPRQLAMYILYTECKVPMEKIGQILGGRDHTTVLHGIKKVEQEVTRDREIQRLLIEVKQHVS